MIKERDRQRKKSKREKKRLCLCECERLQKVNNCPNIKKRDHESKRGQIVRKTKRQ